MIAGTLIDQLGLGAKRSGMSAPRETRPLTTPLAAAPQQPGFWFHFAESFSPRPRSDLFPVRDSRFQPARGLHKFEGFADELRSLYVSERLGLSNKMCQRLVELLGLQRGWDGENAKPLRPEEMAHTVGLLIILNSTFRRFCEPFLAPTIGGFAQLEWHNERRTLEFEGTPTGWSIVGSEMTSRGEKAYHEADVSRSKIDELVAAYRWFEGTELIWPII